MQAHSDVVVLGGGPAGVAAARTVARMGSKALLLDSGRLGGISTNGGTVPARALAHAARLMRESQQLAVYGLDAPPASVNAGRLLARVDEVCKHLHQAKEIADQARLLGIEVHEHVGETRFVAPNRIRCANGLEVTGGKFIVCVGGHARELTIPGAELAVKLSDIWTLSALPRSIAIVGTGHTGCQVGSILNAFGVKVHMFELGSRVMPLEDIDVSAEMERLFALHGVSITKNFQAVEAVEPVGGVKRLIYRKDDKVQTLDVDAVMFAVGWTAATESLGLAELGVEMERSYIKTDEYLRTTVPHIYAAGDVTGRMMLVSGATHQGHVAAVNALTGETKTVAHRIVSTGSFTDPEYGGVGLREQQAKQQGIDYVTSVIRNEDLTRAIIDGRTDGFCKLIADRQTRKIIGGHIVGERAVETVQLISAIMAGGLAVEQVADMELAFPTYSAIILMAARDLNYKLDPRYADIYDTVHSVSPANKALS